MSELFRRLRLRVSSDSGFTLPELLISISLLSIVSAGIVSSVVAIQRNIAVADATINDLAANRIAIERVGGLLRGAVPLDGSLQRTSIEIEAGDGSDVTFYSATGRDIGENPERVQLEHLGNGDLVERIWSPSPNLAADVASGSVPTYPGTPRSRVIARDIQSPSVFNYWSHSPAGGGPATDACGVVIDSAGGLTQVERSRIDAVSYRLVLREDSSYDNAATDLQGFARFASTFNLGSSSNTRNISCLEGDDGDGFRYDDAYVTP